LIWPFLTEAGVPARLVHQLHGTGHSIAQGIVPIPTGLPPSTARAITKSDLLAFTAGLDTAMAIAAAIVLVAGVVAFLAVGISARGDPPRGRLQRYPTRSRGRAHRAVSKSGACRG
jgi:hypothetical protein